MAKKATVLGTPESNLQAFVRLVRRAQDASERVDYFDLNCDEKSKRQWKSLLKKQDEAFVKLHSFCQKCPEKDLKMR
jgi:hypothetical protein